MIEQTDQRLKQWAASLLNSVNISLTPPGAVSSGEGISLYLMNLVAAPPPRGIKRPPHQIMLYYLVTAWAEDLEQAHRLLGTLLFAALEHNEFEVECEPVPVATWQAFGIHPQPSFMLRVPLRQERPEIPAKLVRAPLVIQSAPLLSLSGIVLGPEDMPLAGARVEFPTLQIVEYTDATGRFTFPIVPGTPAAKFLRIRAKGREISIRVDQHSADSAPLVIRFDQLEE